ncbi:MAG: hypothetical protein ACJZ6C_05800 [Candidatus Poriferisodalaceae bacterium]
MARTSVSMTQRSTPGTCPKQQACPHNLDDELCSAALATLNSIERISEICDPAWRIAAGARLRQSDDPVEPVDRLHGTDSDPVEGQTLNELGPRIFAHVSI